VAISLHDLGLLHGAQLRLALVVLIHLNSPKYVKHNLNVHHSNYLSDVTMNFRKTSPIPCPCLSAARRLMRRRNRTRRQRITDVEHQGVTSDPITP